MGKKALLILIFTVLFLPYVQQNLSLFKIKDLEGNIVSTGQISFSLNDWFSSVFQINQDSYLKENFGFRKTLVRLCNQYRFWLYRLNFNREVVLGKNDVLLAEDY